MNCFELKLYRVEQWHSFRDGIVALDGHACRRCGKSREQGAILQVHHLEYQAGQAPWDYPPSAVETLCKGCHAAEHGIIRPPIGWEFLGRDDAGDLCEHCEYCGTEIRYIFYIWHPNWEPMAVGEICCDNLTGTQLASNFVESQRRFQSRLARFLASSRWRTDYGVVSIRQQKIRVDIHQVGPSAFRIHMNYLPGRQVFSTLEDAKIAAFRVIEDGRASEYLKKHQ